MVGRKGHLIPRGVCNSHGVNIVDSRGELANPPHSCALSEGPRGGGVLSELICE